jgi:hypothetical protein
LLSPPKHPSQLHPDTRNATQQPLNSISVTTSAAPRRKVAPPRTPSRATSTSARSSATAASPSPPSRCVADLKNSPPSLCQKQCHLFLVSPHCLSPNSFSISTHTHTYTHTHLQTTTGHQPEDQQEDDSEGVQEEVQLQRLPSARSRPRRDHPAAGRPTQGGAGRD